MASSDLPDSGINVAETHSVSESEVSNKMKKKIYNFLTRFIKCSNSVEPSVEEDRKTEENSNVEEEKQEEDAESEISGEEIDWDSKWESECRDIEESEYENKKKISSLFPRFLKCSNSQSSDSPELSEEDRISGLRKEMDDTIEELDRSKLYHEMVCMWEKDSEFRSNVARVLLGSSSSSSSSPPSRSTDNNNSKMLMVIYALGSIEESFYSRFQLALAILLKRDFPHWISDVEAFDPVFSPIDVRVMESFEIKVLEENEECSRRIEEPTLFFMPFAPFKHTGNLFKANWSPSCLNQMMLLTDCFNDVMKYWKSVDSKPRKTTILKPYPFCKEYYEARESIDYIEAIEEHKAEYSITSESKFRSPLDNFCCHFFHLYPDIDMDSLLKGVPSREKRLKILKRRTKHNFRHFWR